MLVFSRLNSTSIMPNLDGSAKLRYNFFCSESRCKIMNKSFADLSDVINYSCCIVDLHSGTYGAIHAGKRYFLSLIFDSELHDCIKETLSTEELGVIACRGLNLKEIEH